MKPRNNPSSYKGLVVAVVAAGVACAVAFGAPINNTQTQAILAVVAALAALVAGVLGDRGTTPQANPHTEDGRRLVPAADQVEADAGKERLQDTTITEIRGDPHHG